MNRKNLTAALVALLAAVLAGCNAHIEIKPDGSCLVNTARTAAVSCAGSTVLTSKVAVSDATLQELVRQADVILPQKD